MPTSKKTPAATKPPEITVHHLYGLGEIAARIDSLVRNKESIARRHLAKLKQPAIRECIYEMEVVKLFVSNEQQHARISNLIEKFKTRLRA